MTGASHRLLVLGGARSGKSAFAQAEAEASGLDLVFLATAEAWDEEMAVRIAAHRASRDERWRTLEVPLALGEGLRTSAAPHRLLLVDCLTLWLGNLMHAQREDAEIDREAAALAETAGRLPGRVIFVSNEVGWGIVPDTPLGRRFRDAQGRLNQTMARACDTVVLVAAGLPLTLKPQDVRTKDQLLTRT